MGRANEGRGPEGGRALRSDEWSGGVGGCPGRLGGGHMVVRTLGWKVEFAVVWACSGENGRLVNGRQRRTCGCGDILWYK